MCYAKRSKESLHRFSTSAVIDYYSKYFNSRDRGSSYSNLPTQASFWVSFTIDHRFVGLASHYSYAYDMAPFWRLVRSKLSPERRSPAIPLH